MHHHHGGIQHESGRSCALCIWALRLNQHVVKGGSGRGGFSSSGRFPLTSENKNDGFLSACGGCKMVHSLEVVALSTVWVAWEVTESSSVWTSEVEISASGHTSSYSHCTVQFLKYLFMNKWKHCKTTLFIRAHPIMERMLNEFLRDAVFVY